MQKTVLLFHASNIEAHPVYPYAFIQVPAVARRAGIEVNCQELLGVPQESWPQVIQSLIDYYHPSMILITLRNTDSMVLEDYQAQASLEGNERAYFPIECTKELIIAVRAVSDLTIVLGGFGFSIMPAEIMHYLRPDLGVFGDPDGFFTHFEAIQAGNLSKVPNLMYFQEEQLISNPHRIFPPLDAPEYTSQAIEAMMDFYQAFPKPGFVGAPVEISRGCPHACLFCSEPHVKGQQVRYRDLSAVMADIELLAANGIREIYMISSELNPEGNAFILQLAERIHAFNDLQPEDCQVTWFGANYLLNLSFAEYESLYRSGFTGGWFDITALDDANARAIRTPYRNASLLTHLKTYTQFESQRFEQMQAGAACHSSDPCCELTAQHADFKMSWTMFLGNPATTSQTIRDTLRIANREGLASRFTGCHLIKNLRVFDYEKPDQATLDVTFSVTPDLARTRYRQILPSFAYPPALLQELGSGAEIARLFSHIEETYLSTKYQTTRDWHSFVHNNATLESIVSWLAELSNTQGIRLPAFITPEIQGEAAPALAQLFSAESPEDEKRSSQDLAKRVVNSLISICLDTYPELLAALDLPASQDEFEHMTPYELAVILYSRWPSEQELFGFLSSQTRGRDRSCACPPPNVGPLSEAKQDYIRFCVQAMLYRFNIQLNPRYRTLFVEPP